MALITVHKATVHQRNLTKNYLKAVVESCDSVAYFNIIANPLHTAIVHKRICPPSDSEISRLRERFEGINAVQLLLSENSVMFTIGSEGLNRSPMINITHINPPLLSLALNQEALLAEKDNIADEDNVEEVDLSAWTGLPRIIQYHWSRFNDKLRTHIMDCMMTHFQSHPEANTYHLDNPNAFFTGNGQRYFPNIPVGLPTGKVRDLMQVLVSLERVNLSQVMPAETERLKFRLNRETPSLDGPRF